MVLVLLLLLLPSLLYAVDTIHTEEITVKSRPWDMPGEVTSPVSSFSSDRLAALGVTSGKQLSTFVPNLWMPDYGSAMTSSVYLRGLGTRIDQPVIAVYVDDMPLADKNAYDFDLADVRRIDVFRGPQATLYGRNAMMGVMNVSTGRMADDPPLAGTMEYGTAGHVKASASWHNGTWEASAGYRRSSGFFTNQYDGSAVDPYDGGFARVRYEQRRDRLEIRNQVSWSALQQGAYPYSHLQGDTVQAVCYNDDGAYRRTILTDAAVIRWHTDRYHVQWIPSVQFLSDRMNMDQDFTSRSMFTLEQRQRQYATTQDMNIRPAHHPSWWNRQTGIYLMAKYNDMTAPVVFKQQGIDGLILDHANQGIPASLGQLRFEETSFPIHSDFDLFTGNIALYHESYWTKNRWQWVTGFRIDYEWNTMAYNSFSQIHYRLDPTMLSFRPFTTRYSGHESDSYLQCMPRISVSYQVFRRPDAPTLQLFASVSEGYKAGGFNTQLFSDILQQEMMLGLMNDKENRVQLLVAFDENGQGYLIGFRYDYTDGETDTVAKNISGLPVGSTIQLLCDRYQYDGTYDNSYYWGDPITVTEGLVTVSDVYVDASRARRTYRLTDIYNQNYWTESY